ncbi:L-fucose/L-arabinose isomerase family protein [Verrucomicrobiota bacterium]
MTARPNTPLLGLCPIGKFVFSHEDAIRRKQELQARLRRWGVNFVDLEGVLEDGLVRDQQHVDPVVCHFREKDIDCLFLPHCNFGTEGAVGMVAKKLGVPALLWGPRDEAPEPDGTRLRDSLCGMFASSKVLHKLGVPFTYIENCRIDEPPLRDGLDTFLRAVNAAKPLRSGLRIGHIGQRIDFFWTTIVNESELLERFNVEVIPLDMVTFIDAATSRVVRNRSDYAKEAKRLRSECDIEGFEDDEPLMRILAVRDEMLGLVDTRGLEALAVQDFTSLVDAMGAYCFFANSMVSDVCPVACESDIHGAVSAVLLQRACMCAQSVFVADLTVRHPENDNAVLLWHAGAPLSMKHPEAKVRLDRHWILPSPLAGMPHFRMKDGPITVARFDGDRGEYSLAVGQGSSADGPETQNNYVWMEVDNWSHWERALMQGPFIHHAAMTYDHVADALVEACKYVPGLYPVRLDEGVREHG